MNKMSTGSICLTDLIEKAKEGHSAFQKSQVNNKIYVNVILWSNEEADKYGNTHSMQLNSAKEKKEIEGRVYIGNFKPVDKKEPTPLNENDIKTFTEVADDLPF